MSSGDVFHLWLLGTIVYLTLLVAKLLKTVEVQTEFLDYFARTIQSSGSSLICVVSDIGKTVNIALKLSSQ